MMRASRWQRRYSTCVLTVLLLHSAAFCTTPLPHILFVLVDDVGFADVGFTGGTAIPTPHLDALAAEGLWLQNYYTHPVCTPTRTALMTGRYSAASGVQHPFLVGDEGLPLALSSAHGGEGLLPEMLQEQFGYRTLMTGKWHLGHSTWQHMPTRRGFDRFYGFLTAAVSHDTKYLWTPQLSGHDLWSQEMPTMNQTHSSALYTDKLIAMAAEERKTYPNNPLFMYLALGAAHSPLQSTSDHLKRCSHLHSSMRRRYCGLVQSIDDAMNQMVVSLEMMGMKDDTIIVFSSDNGGQPWEGARNYPLRGAKHTPFEGGSRVPAFVWLPPRLRHSKAHSFEGLMHVADWKPTFEGILSRLSGMQPSGDAAVSRLGGVDQSLALLEGQPSAREDVLLHYSNSNTMYGSATVGYRSGQWKLVVDQHGGGDLSRRFKEPRTYWDWVAPTPVVVDYVAEVCLIGATYVFPADHLFIVDELINRFALLWTHTHLRLVGLENWGMNRSSEPPSSKLSQGRPVLYDLSSDPSEEIDVSADYPDVLDEMISKVLAIEGDIRESLLNVRHEERRLQQSEEYRSARRSTVQLLLDPATGLAFHGPWLSASEAASKGLRLVDVESRFVAPMVVAQYFIVAEALSLAVLLVVGLFACSYCCCCCCHVRSPDVKKRLRVTETKKQQ